MGERYRTLVDVFEHYTNDLFKRIGVDRSESTWWRYRAVLGHLRAFLKYEYNLHDIPLLELEQSFIEQYRKYPLIPTLWMIFEDSTFAFRSGDKHRSRRIYGK